MLTLESRTPATRSVGKHPVVDTVADAHGQSLTLAQPLNGQLTIDLTMQQVLRLLNHQPVRLHGYNLTLKCTRR